MAMQRQSGIQVDDVPAELSSAAALAQYLRLQQFQTDYLAWLRACENQPDIDPYNYREIR